MPMFRIEVLSDSPAIRAMLVEILVEVVRNGGSVGFLHPLPIETADTFWARRSLRRRGASESSWAPGTAASGRGLSLCS